MAYSRPRLAAAPAAEQVTADMAGIGMAFAAEASKSPDIETTLVAASSAGMIEHDLRTLSVLTTWLGIHLRYVNVARLLRTLHSQPSPRVLAYWAAVAEWRKDDRRLSKVRGLHIGDRVDVLPVGTDFQLRRRGEDPRFSSTCLRVPLGTLRDRADDVASPVQLARLHPTYRTRIRMGPSWRADAWAALEQTPTLTASALGRSVGCAFATAWCVKRDFELLRASAGVLGAANAL